MIDLKTAVRNVWPEFHSHSKNVHLTTFYTFTNYWEIWGMTIFALTVAALVPLWIITVIHYQLIQHSVDSELALRTERVTSNAKRTVVFFMEERLNALTFTVNEMGYATLVDDRMLHEILTNLKLGFGGLTDLSVIDEAGNQIAYAGPFNLEGKNYKTQPWFIQSLKQDNFVSEVFTGYRGVPHIIIAVRSAAPDGSLFILRATLDTERLLQKIHSYKTGEHADIFLINKQGILQTPSSNFGKVFTRTTFKIPDYSPRTQILTETRQDVGNIIIGYSFIASPVFESPFILIVQKKKAGMMDVWVNLRRDFNWIIGVSALITVVVITIASTYMVNKLYRADRTKAETMLQMEQNQQLASIGQLAAGVAHEINNPLALINETAGYVRDLYSFDQTDRDDAEIMENLDAILEAVERCGTITRQLLGFVRQFDIKIRQVDLSEMIPAVLSFHKKEAEYKNIHVTLNIPETIPAIRTDSGKLQQILVNLVNNAFDAVSEDGCLDIIVSQPEPGSVRIVVQDTGCGIPEAHLKKIAEPFFSTKQENKGTGLGLSITYGLVKKLQGHISVQSTEGVGTSFTITLPETIQEEKTE